MPDAYDIETRFFCAELWIERGMTYEQISARTGVSVQTLARWAEADGWRKQRREYRAAHRAIKSNITRLRTALIKKALKTLNPQDVYAVTSLEGTMLRAKQLEEGIGEAPSAEVIREIKTPKDAILALQTAIEQRINAMLARGDVSLSAVKDVKHCLELIDELREKYLPNDEKQPRRELDGQTLQQIKDIYGIN